MPCWWSPQIGKFIEDNCQLSFRKISVALKKEIGADVSETSLRPFVREARRDRQEDNEAHIENVRSKQLLALEEAVITELKKSIQILQGYRSKVEEALTMEGSESNTKPYYAQARMVEVYERFVIDLAKHLVEMGSRNKIMDINIETADGKKSLADILNEEE